MSLRTVLFSVASIVVVTAGHVAAQTRPDPGALQVAGQVRPSPATNPDVLGAERLFSAWMEGQIAYRMLPGIVVGVVADQ